jgi:hypothetical protein
MSDLTPPTRDRKLITAAVLIGLIVGAGLFVVVVRLLGDDAKVDAPDPGPPTATSGTSGASSICGLPDGRQVLPTAAPQTKWDLQGSMAAPKSKAFGPGQEERGVHSCFARNANGALFAAVRFYSDAFALGEKLGRDFIERWYTDGQAKKDALATVDEGASSDRTPVAQQVAGFRVDNYTRDRATLTLVTRESDGPTAGQLRAWPITVVWVHGDWKVDIDNGSSAPPSRIASLTGFIPWSGVS